MSEHVGFRQVPLTQVDERQSASDPQDAPAAQRPQRGPPQSTPVSVPSLVWFPQDAIRQDASWHTVVAQSASVAQGCPVLHSGQWPPQSTPTSFPFFTPSLQVGSSQSPSASHTRLSQSPPNEQGCPAGQPVQGPPQSVPVSLPFFTPSVQLGAGSEGASLPAPSVPPPLPPVAGDPPVA